MTSDDLADQHLKRAMELIEQEFVAGGEIDQRKVFDAMAHLRTGAVMNIMGDDDAK